MDYSDQMSQSHYLGFLCCVSRFLTLGYFGWVSNSIPGIGLLHSSVTITRGGIPAFYVSIASGGLLLRLVSIGGGGILKGSVSIIVDGLLASLVSMPSPGLLQRSVSILG